jgi:hypothetical protein
LRLALVPTDGLDHHGHPMRLAQILNMFGWNMPRTGVERQNMPWTGGRWS